MAEFVFVSPGAKFRERDLTFVTRNVGITTLGLVGETLKGPAFEHIFIQDKGQFKTRFGAQSIERFASGDKGLKWVCSVVLKMQANNSVDQCRV